MATEGYVAWISSVGVIVASFGNMAISVYLASRAKRDRRAVIVDERRLASFEELWLILQSLDFAARDANASISKTAQHDISNAILNFIQSQRSIYIDNEDERILREILSEIRSNSAKSLGSNLAILKSSVRNKL